VNKQTFNYIVTPSVVPADTDTAVTIHPLGDNTRFVADVTYTVEIRPVETFCSNYADLPVIRYHINPNSNGDLVLSHRFEGEQRHAIKLIRPQEDLNATPYHDITHRGKFHDNKEAVLYVYSLAADLYGTRCFKGELHCHTYESDGIQDVRHTVGNYRAAGYDFLAITDHYISMSAEKAQQIYADSPMDMTLLLGEECHVPTEQIHAVHIGGTQSVNARYRNDPEKAQREVAAIEEELTHLPSHINKNDYAWRIWIARKARECGGLSILAHPHWIWFDTYFMASAITQQLLTDGVYDALDMTDQEADTTVALWAEMQARGRRIPVVGCSDSHRTDASRPTRPVSGGYTLVFAENRNEETLISAIKNGHCVAVNAVGDPERIYGPYRLVKYARFLLDNYYPMYMRLCHGQGPLAAAYPASKDALTLLNQQSEAFARYFFGY